MAKKVLFLLLFICCPSYSFLPKTTRTRYGDVSEILNQGHQTWSRVQPRTGYSTELAEKGWNGKWEGDDRRFLTRLRRRIKSRSNLSGSGIKNYLLYLNLFFYLYQTITTVDFIRQGHASYWPKYAFSMILDATIGSSVNGPLTMDFCYANSLSHQPHRYLTSGFIHGGFVHFLVNMLLLRGQPSWLSSGLGGPLYLTTYIVSIVTGNIAHLEYTKNPFDKTLCMGASGAISGLYGLMFVSLVKMQNSKTTSQVLKGMGMMFLMSLLSMNVTTSSILGGFAGGILVGILCAPSYKQSYSMRRKNSVEYDPAPRDYRSAMGFGIIPTERGLVPLPLLWSALAIVLVAAGPKFRSIPSVILKGFLFPGSLLKL